jgi:hypothetical protein
MTATRADMRGCCLPRHTSGTSDPANARLLAIRRGAVDFGRVQDFHACAERDLLVAYATKLDGVEGTLLRIPGGVAICTLIGPDGRLDNARGWREGERCTAKQSGRALCAERL